MELEVLAGLLARLAAGILAVQAEHTPVAMGEAVSWAAAAAYHGGRAGVDPFELIGIARNETDFRPRLVGPDGKDCGLLQTRVVYSRYRCAELRRDPWKAFEEGARMLSDRQATCLVRHPDDLTRCRLNGYNQGARYRRRGYKGAYWLRVKCFAEAAREGVVPRGDCRRARDRSDLARLIRGPTEVALR